MSAALGLLILRLVIGLTLAGHGAQKVFGWWGGPGMGGWTAAMVRMRVRPAALWAWVAALGELAGGILLAVGLLSPIGNLAIAGAMLVAIALVHWSKGFWAGRGGYEFNLSLLAAVTALALTGPGRLSLDAALGIAMPRALILAGTAAVLAGVLVALLTRSSESPA